MSIEQSSGGLRFPFNHQSFLKTHPDYAVAYAEHQEKVKERTKRLSLIVQVETGEIEGIIFRKWN